MLGLNIHLCPILFDVRCAYANSAAAKVDPMLNDCFSDRGVKYLLENYEGGACWFDVGLVCALTVARVYQFCRIIDAWVVLNLGQSAPH